MDSTNITIIIVAVILVILLLYVAFSMKKSNNTNWPPSVSKCPDFWVDVSTAGDGSKCINPHHIGTCNLPSKGNDNEKNFDVAPFNDDDGNCQKYRWATKCNVSWDGITYGVTNPCSNSK